MMAAQKTMTTQEAALLYQSFGWSVIPLKPRDKRPLIPWKDYQTRKATEEELFEWFADTNNNIGVVAGQLSNLTIVDCDSEEAIQFFEQTSLEAGCTLETYKVKTPKGQHYYFLFKPGSSNFQAKKEWPGIDLRSEGGFCAAPPSIHPTGIPYTILEDTELQEAPGWLFEKAPVQTVVRPEDNADVFAPCEEGGRNMALTKLAGSLLPKLPFSAVLATCRLWNQQNTLPLPDDELLRTVESVAALEARKSCEEKPSPPRGPNSTKPRCMD